MFLHATARSLGEPYRQRAPFDNMAWQMFIKTTSQSLLRSTIANAATIFEGSLLAFRRHLRLILHLR